MAFHMSAEEIRATVRRLAAEILAAREGRVLVLAGILKGCVTFVSDLARAVDELEPGVPVELDFLECASYEGTSSSGTVQCKLGPQLDCRGKYVVVVDTVLESGRTLVKAAECYEGLGAAALDFCVLLDKRCRREVPVEARFRGLEIGDEFIIGYGIDYNQRYRELSCLRTITEAEKNI